MIYRPLGNTGYQVSAITYGGIVSMKDGQPSSDRYVSWAIDQGINYFDVAPSYDDAQEKLGNIPPGNFDHFSFGVNNVEELLNNPLSEAEKNMLCEHLKEVKDYPFFTVD